VSVSSSKKKDDDETRESTLVVELTAARWRHFGWAVAGLVVGTVMIVRMGEIGLVLGGAVILGGLMAARSFVMTLLHPPGVIAVREGEVVLPGQVSSGVARTVPLGELRHAYLLRRALPWNHTGPVLVVETRRGVFQYPRDWFAGENDQRRVFTALNRRLGRIL
jgi:hypothetical protein